MSHTLLPYNLRGRMIEKTGKTERVRVLIFNEFDHILLGFSHFANEYFLPGGGVDPDESLEDAVRREVLEETGLTVTYCHFLFKYGNDSVFIAETAGCPIPENGLKDPDQEFSRLEWLSPFALPSDTSEYAEEVIFNYLRQTDKADDDAMNKVLSGKIDVMVDGKKVYELDDDEIWLTLPRLAQERTKGRKVTFVQRNNDGEVLNAEVSIETSDEILQDLVDVHFPGLGSPTIESIKTTDFLGETLYIDGEPRIRINDVILTDLKLYKQVLAHELIHYFLYLTFGSEVDQHGPLFKEIAEAINAIEGKGYVSEIANGTKFNVG